MHKFIMSRVRRDSRKPITDELAKALESRMLQKAERDRRVARFMCMLFLSSGLDVPFEDESDDGPVSNFQATCNLSQLMIDFPL